MTTIMTEPAVHGSGLGTAGSLASDVADRNAAVARRFVEELWNRADMDVADAIFAPDCVAHTHTQHHDGPDISARRGPQHIKRIIAAWRMAFPDWHIEISNLFADSEKVILLTTGYGTHRGELMGVRPTGRRVAFTGMRVFRFVDGKIAEYWVLWDWLGLWQQLGEIPLRHQPQQSLKLQLRSLLLSSVTRLVQRLIATSRMFFRRAQTGQLDSGSAVISR